MYNISFYNEKRDTTEKLMIVSPKDDGSYINDISGCLEIGALDPRQICGLVCVIAEKIDKDLGPIRAIEVAGNMLNRAIHSTNKTIHSKREEERVGPSLDWYFQ